MRLDPERRKARKEQQRIWREANPERWRYLGRKNRYKARYGITLAEKDAMFAKQGGVCAICSKTPPQHRPWLYLDHDHKTGKIRDLLCQGCNAGLGQFADNESFLLAAVEYLRRHRIAVAA